MAFCGYLKQSTAVDVILGPFVDEDDGKTAETGLTIAQADVRLSKNGANIAQKNDADGCTHDELGNYKCDLDATDTNTLGLLDVMVHESGALPVKQTYQVVTAHWFDTMCSTDYLQVDVIQVEGGDATDAINAACDTALGDYDGPTKAEMDTAHGLLATEAKQDIIDGIVDDILVDTNELQTDWTNAGRLDAILDELTTQGDTNEGKLDTIDTNVDAILVDTAELQTDDVPGLIAALNNLSAADVNAEVDTALVDIHLDHLLAADYDPAAKPGVATALLNEMVENDGGVSRFTANALEEAPTGGSAPTVEEIRTEIDTNSTQLAAIVADTNELQTDWANGGRLDLIADAILADTNELQADWTNTGRLDTIIDSILADTNELQADNTPGALSAIDAKIDTIDGIVDAVLVDTAVIGALGAGLTAIPWNAAWDTEVQSECADALTAYDPPTKAEMDTAHGLLATEAKQDTIDGIVDAILVDTNELQTDLANGGRLDLLIDAILADTAELQGDWVNGGRLDLLVDAIVADTGSLNDTALAEITGASDAPATPTVRQALMLVYMWLRNNTQVTATERRILNDAGTEVLDATMSDDGSVFSQGKLGAA